METCLVVVLLNRDLSLILFMSNILCFIVVSLNLFGLRTKKKNLFCLECSRMYINLFRYKYSFIVLVVYLPGL